MSKHYSCDHLFTQKQFIKYATKIEAFKRIFPEEYKKLLDNIEPDIKQIIDMYKQIIGSESTCH